MQTNLLLDNVLSGESFSEDILDSLLAEQTKEDLFLEYKHAKELEKPDASKEIRKYVSGFANGEGGILIIGVDEKKYKITDVSAPGGGDLAEWAVRCINPIAQYISPPPRFIQLNHKYGKVLIIAVHRSLNLIPIVEDSRLVYYLRFHDQTLKAPEYLVTDILLGRKALPNLTVENCKMYGRQVFNTQNKNNTFNEYYKNLSFSLQLRVENQSLVWADDIRIGLIGWEAGNSDSSVGKHLYSYIDIETPTFNNNPQKLALKHRLMMHRPQLDLTPFSSVDLGIENIQIPFMQPMMARYEYIWNAGVYLMSKNAPPIWYQVILPLAKHSGDNDIKEILEIKRMLVERPQISMK